MTATRSNRIAQVLLIVMGFFVGIVLAIIVSKALLNDTSVLTKQQRKLDVDRAPVEYVRVPGIGRVAYQFLFEELSEPGESLDSFASRIGPRLRAYSDATEFEACGVIATDGKSFGVVVGSSHSHIACVNFSSIVPSGMVSTNETIHSHGVDSRFVANNNDKVLQGQTFQGRAGIMSVNGQKLDNFSAMDIQSGPGYLAAPNGLVLHQAGKIGTTRVVSRVVP